MPSLLDAIHALDVDAVERALAEHGLPDRRDRGQGLLIATREAHLVAENQDGEDEAEEEGVEGARQDAIVHRLIQAGASVMADPSKLEKLLGGEVEDLAFRINIEELDAGDAMACARVWFEQSDARGQGEAWGRAVGPAWVNVVKDRDGAESDDPVLVYAHALLVMLRNNGLRATDLPDGTALQEPFGAQILAWLRDEQAIENGPQAPTPRRVRARG